MQVRSLFYLLNKNKIISMEVIEKNQYIKLRSNFSFLNLKAILKMENINRFL